MIDTKSILESRKLIISLIDEGKIKKPKEGVKDFFMGKAESSLEVSKRLMGLSDELDVYMWVINSSYYSMFFAASALLANFDHQINLEQGKHTITYHALVYYFIDQENRLEKYFVEEFQRAQEQAEELLQIQEPTEQLHEFVSSFKYENLKRKEFTYELGRFAAEGKAKTSLDRAKEFLKVVKDIIE